MFIFNIKNIRKKKNITLYRLSQITGISRAYLIELENNKKTNPTLAVLSKVAEAFNVNVKELFFSEIDIDDLKKEMYSRIEKYGISSEEAMEINQIIDLLINIDMQYKKDSN